MVSRMCRPAPRALSALALALVLASCADSHGRGDRDAGALSDAARVPLPDAGTAPVPDAAAAVDAALDPTCGPRAFDLLCLDHVSAGEPTTVQLVARSGTDCFCEQHLACSARIVSEGVLAIDTSLCPASPACFACHDEAAGACELPALTEGTWRVTIDGEEALELAVVPAGVLPERADVCIRGAITDSCGAIFMPSRFEVGRACHPDRVAPGTRAEIHVFDACGGCVQRGPCEVTVLESMILVRATRMPNSCDIACPPVCNPDEHVCVTPPLAAGGYRVVVDGLPTDESTTIEVAAGPPGVETCLP
jgi:hypothetical protein